MESATGSFKWPRVLFPAARRSTDRVVAWSCSFATLLDAFSGRPRCPLWRPLWPACSSSSRSVSRSVRGPYARSHLNGHVFTSLCPTETLAGVKSGRGTGKRRVARGTVNTSRTQARTCFVANALATGGERERSGDTVARAAVQTVSLLAVFNKPRRAVARHIGPFHANLCSRQLELRISLSVETPCRRLLATTLISAHSLLTCDARSLSLSLLAHI